LAISRRKTSKHRLTRRQSRQTQGMSFLGMRRSLDPM
jgi:hypothetical protein